MNTAAHNDNIIRFQRQKVVGHIYVYCLAVGLLVALLYIVAIGLILLGSDFVSIDLDTLLMFSSCALLLWLTVMLHLLIDFRWASYSIRNKKIHLFNGYYLIPINIPVEAVKAIQPVANHRIFTRGRTGLRLHLQGRWNWLPYPVDFYVEDENLFISTLQHLNPAIEVREEVIQAFRITA